ncbi:hypothetical protein KSS87_022896 [Heliosperma pusillum]|nr:hypothetical protein KSS87_022896 [Heliosperma pusillum]
MLDINLFRADKGGNPELIRESQRRRFKDVAIVDEIIALDLEWRRGRGYARQWPALYGWDDEAEESGDLEGGKEKEEREKKESCSWSSMGMMEVRKGWGMQFELESLRKDFNRMNKEVARLKIAGEDASATIKSTEDNKRSTAEMEAEVQEKRAALHAKLELVGNLIHDTVPISIDEANNQVIRTWGEQRIEANLISHVDLVELLGIVDTKRGSNVAGGRGFYLKGDGVLLNQALINYGLAFMSNKEYTPLMTPFFMRKDIMARCAQLAQFDEELYKVTGEGEDKYLIATAEQPLCAYHLDDWMHPNDLPIRYVGYSSCFRKEAGSHGRDTLGIFRVHQFEKVEQFCITAPDDNKSWKMLEEMITNSEEFYQSLKLPYQIVAIVSGALNDAAAKKYDLEAWFPASKTYRELVSCSNCTDYQSRKLEIRFGQKKSNDQNKQYVHLLNSTLTATERTLCCILETYQKEDGVEIPEVLRPFMGGKTFIPFKNKPVPASDAKKKKPKA